MTTSRALRRLLCLLLTLTMVLSVTVPAFANPLTDKTAETPLADGRLIEQEEHALSDIVRVTIELDQPSTFDAGYSMNNVAENAAAVSYRQSLRSSQAALTNQIEAAVGSKLDVKWNITLTMNAISANVRYGDIAKIKSIPGVKDVFLENRYDPPTTVEGEEGDRPNTANTSTYMVGAADTWAEGYTGAGSRIAIIDTGLDTTHQSMNADAFNYAIQQTGKNVSLFTSANLSSIKSQLNGSGATYVSAKIPFGYNYVDENTTINHLSDTQGEHGSHVAGIAAANRYIKSGSSYVEAADSVHVVGMAPDAQLFIMKVFGSGGGAYDSDYMVAIEDAIVLGCDAVNLSLGSSSQGFTYSTSYQTTMNKIANASSNTKTVVSISAGNAYDFPYWLDNGELYIQDAYMHTGGSPGSYTNSLCVASAENTGVTGSPLTFNGSQKVFYNETDSTGAKMTTIGGSYSYVYVDAPGNASDYSTVNSAVSLSGKIVICNRGDISFYEKGNNLKSYNPKALIVANNAAGTINMSLDDYTGTFPMVSITLADANTIKANSTAHTAGSITYYTGTVSVSSEVSHMQVTDNAEMSVFSSWGVPGSLLMKPEITAPGGNIYSLWGTNKTSSGNVGGSDKYELMSGTSMAAPHITGLTATLGQYLRENNVTLSGHTTRQIAQSLLMSTAVPMHIGSKTGPYYPTIQVGAGLANVHNAVHASSVIFMGSDATASYADGKVKAELGDLPAKQGSWSYTFQINNMASKAQTYALRTDLFTQDVDNSGDYPLMSKSTTNLDWPVTYTVDGASATSVTVAAGSSKTVKVTITVPGDMSAFDAIYPAGCYLEGYTFVESSTISSDGEKLDVQHSIPILGYYGSWTDPSMFDNMSYVDANVYGVTRTPYSGVSNTNYMTYTRGSSSSTKYVTGNPYTAEQPFPY
ncbi:MAG: S8 family serine peptidase, partial [Oscillospiraceae bacterium]|nr:S8 family serine peptidase [Oscillospiraceae bacterium]